MSPFLKRFLITSALAIVLILVGAIVAQGSARRSGDATKQGSDVASAPADPSAAASPTSDVPSAATGSVATPDSTTPASTTPDSTTPASSTPAAATEAPAITAPRYTARVPAGMTAPEAPQQLGSLDPKVAPARFTFSRNAAGIDRIVAADIWLTAEDAAQARRARADDDLAALPDDSRRYVLAQSSRFGDVALPVLAARVLEIDGATVSLFEAVWSETAPGTFTTEIADESGAAVGRFTRVFRLGPTGFDVALEQRFVNLSGAPMRVRLLQNGPGDRPYDPKTLTEVRRYHFGYLYPETRDPSRTIVSANGQLYDRSQFSKQVAQDEPVVWPNQSSTEGGLTLSWFGSTDRYFALAVHAPYAPPSVASKALANVEEISAFSNGRERTDEVLFTSLWSPRTDVAAGAEASFDIGIYAGPLDRKILATAEPMSGLNMRALVVYLMSGCCSWCTFAWLADGMLWFLSFLHSYVVFDWGLSIIALVVVVRFVLHPWQKKSQISMQRFSRGMAALKPELDALQKKFKDDPQRMQQEQWRLFKERGISPAGCVGGMLPTFAQMPIWMALYATLFFAFELRQQSAFFGIFQQFGGWRFLADLAEPDRFLSFPAINLYFFSVSSLNLLPILMGVVFYLQQKYMTPPMAPNMTDEQKSQQAMMKWMMVIMFPLMTYAAPSGLTLYILTSTCIGIIESRSIKKQVDAMDLNAKPDPNAKKGIIARAIEQALERAQEKNRGGDKRRFKER
ncbi:MAG: YidC/Oxa1 family insertase periplasmic-domain containing protein [bacterium]